MKHAVLISFLAYFFSMNTAQAYLDPGSGSYIIQVTIGLVAGAIFMLKNYWAFFKGWFLKLLGKDKKQD